MIEVYFKNNDLKKFTSLHQVPLDPGDLFSIRLIDYTEEELQELSSKFDLDLSIFTQREDIEISSHYVEKPNQLSFHFSIPNYSTSDTLEEEEVFILIKKDIIFSFLTSRIEENLNQLSAYKYSFDQLLFESHQHLLMFQLGIISDYYADLVESNAKRIKQIFQNTLKSDQFVRKDLDTITELNFNHLLIKESLSGFHRILILLKRNNIKAEYITKEIDAELDDLTVIAEHIQYNFDRLDDLKENINSKIDLEQNNIFKLLTIITVCISLPTLIAGIYGMNFHNMPELDWRLGYPLVVVAMVLSFVIPLLLFKWKKWF